MDERTVLRKAKEVLLERGWNQGGYEALDGSVCLAGAIRLTVTGEPSRRVGEPLRSRLRSPLWAVMGSDFVDDADIAYWNDHEAEGVGDVIDLLDRAIASLDHETEPQKVAA